MRNVEKTIMKIIICLILRKNRYLVNVSEGNDDLRNKSGKKMKKSLQIK
ncbi:hypothetical protein Q787_06520 [Ornithobacterium rhinotracheale H06-030791]|uniref:Uncharacterized protein n=1 Tax=Ornithobacterium rhinotracheale (strain ATCC 51463 / DSM 15997 / CCUG 23171 / CIP 104009 / LMG 9086) TaxID=867902 RepID=I3ZYM2_ORNRL|nr:hypothetical protein Ornrh_0605 [Ornithobacterium rhinotracheale DSM 15997]AIQ00547.1 hypothetical protein Q785_06705 [Ornithobacterium rhinotracheale ORT-UMN 88]KGB66665.1 hypothetical protein Q787_06520 [Ornithobacterium rhinotracheale H06-030791]